MKEKPLIPREHGAYAEIAVPLLTALWMRAPTRGAVAWTVAAVVTFFAHEPLLVFLGRRGARAQKTRGRRAAILLAAFAGVVLVATIVGLVASPIGARVSVLVPAVLAAIVAWLVARRAEKTAVGEVLVGATLSASALPVALASGVPPATALLVWVVFAAGFGASTLAVRAVIERARGSASVTSSMVRAAGSASLLVAAIILHLTRTVPAFVPSAAAPLVLFSVALNVAPPSPKRLRTLGWLLVAAALVTGVIVRRLA